MSIAANIYKIHDKISSACARVGRSEKDVEIVAVSKTVGAEKIQQAVQSGIKIIGENRVQEALYKYQQVGHIAEWHMVGHLQTNKVKQALNIFNVIQSVDSVKLAQEISKRALFENRCFDILIEVNTSGEYTKFGLEPQKVTDFILKVADLSGIRIIGLMTIGAFLPNPEDVRPCFSTLRVLFEKIRELHIPNVVMEHLSMGMTNDFEIAVEEGATLVRIGKAIFGER